MFKANPPILFPDIVHTITGVRWGGHNTSLDHCHIQFRDAEGKALQLEVPIATGTALVVWVREEGHDWPIKIR